MYGASRGRPCDSVASCLKLLDRLLLHLFSETVRDNVVFNDVTITSSLPSDVIILGINFLFSSKMSPRDGSCQTLRNCVYMY